MSARRVRGNELYESIFNLMGASTFKSVNKMTRDRFYAVLALQSSRVYFVYTV